MILEDEPLVVCVTGAAGQIAYALLPSLCDGSIFGVHQVKKTTENDNKNDQFKSLMTLFKSNFRKLI